MEQLKAMKERLIAAAQGEMNHLDSTDAKELGEVVDMIKDLSEAIYYCSITEAMKDNDKEKQHYHTNNNTYYYTTKQMMPPYDEEYNRGRVYYGGGQGSSNSGGNQGGNSGAFARGGNNSRSSAYYSEYENEYPGIYFPDPREGRSRQSRRNYMESKELHKDSNTQMKELENYIQDLSSDITEMIENASPEEKQVLQQKIMTLSSKIK